MAGQIKRVDAAAKTTESWWSLLVSDGGLGHTVFKWVWPVIGGVIAAGVASVTGWISSYGVAGWAATITIGVLATIWGMVGIEMVRTRRFLRLHGIQSHAEQSPDLDGLIDARLDAHLATKLRAEFAPHSDIHQRDVKISELSDRINSLRGLTESLIAANQTHGNDLSGKFGDLLEHIDRRTEGLGERLDNIDFAFAAIHNRELHERCFARLKTDFEKIAAPIDAGNGITVPGPWLHSVKSWRVDLEQWLNLVEYYAMNVTDKVLEIPEHIYDGVWNFDEKALEANQVHRYKEVAIWWHNATEHKPRIDKCFVYAISHTPSKKGRLDPPPRPNED